MPKHLDRRGEADMVDRRTNLPKPATLLKSRLKVQLRQDLGMSNIRNDIGPSGSWLLGRRMI